MMSFLKYKDEAVVLPSEKWKSLSCVCLFLTSWTVACQAPPSMEFSRQEYWSGYSLLQGIFPTQGLNPGGFFTVWAPREARLSGLLPVSPLLRAVWLTAPCFPGHWPEGGPLASHGSRLEIHVHLFIFLFGYCVEISKVLSSVSRFSCSRFGHMALDNLLSTGNCQKSVQ